MKPRKSSATRGSSSSPCCSSCLLRSCRPSSPVSHSTGEGMLEYVWFCVRQHLTFDSTSKTGVGGSILHPQKHYCASRNRLGQLGPVFPVFFSTDSSVLQSWTGISPYPSASQPCPEILVGLREDGIISLGLPSYDSCRKSAYSCGVRSKLLQNGLFHTCSGSAVTLDSLLDQEK